MLLNDSIADGKSQSCAFPSGFCGEERIIDLLDIFRADADAGVLNNDFNLRVDGIREDPQFAALRHRVARIDEESQEDLLYVARTGEQHRVLCPPLAVE